MLHFEAENIYFENEVKAERKCMLYLFYVSLGSLYNVSTSEWGFGNACLYLLHAANETFHD